MTCNQARAPRDSVAYGRVCWWLRLNGLPPALIRKQPKRIGISWLAKSLSRMSGTFVDDKTLRVALEDSGYQIVEIFSCLDTSSRAGTLLEPDMVSRLMQQMSDAVEHVPVA